MRLGAGRGNERCRGGEARTRQGGLWGSESSRAPPGRLKNQQQEVGREYGRGGSACASERFRGKAMCGRREEGVLYELVAERQRGY